MTELNPLSFPFFQNALIGGILISFLAPQIGKFLVIKKYSLISDTLSHASLVGITLAIIFNFSTLIGAFISCLIAIIFIEKNSKSEFSTADSTFALILTGSLSMALTISAIYKKNLSSLHTFFFGSINTINQTELIILFTLALVSTIFLKFIHQKLLYISFDIETTKAKYFNNSKYNLIFLILTSISIIISIQIMGALLTGALMILPNLSSFKIANSLKSASVIATIQSLLAVTLGLFTSFYLEIPTGASISNFLIIFFLLTTLLSRHYKRH